MGLHEKLNDLRFKTVVRSVAFLSQSQTNFMTGIKLIKSEVVPWTPFVVCEKGHTPLV